VANITGTAGNDTLQGTAQTETIRGLDGNDILYGAFNDTLIGGNGDDQLILTIDQSSIFTADGGAGFNVISLNLPEATTPQVFSLAASLAAGARMSNFGSLYIRGSYGDDSIIGSALEESISGGAGNDWLRGGDGRDALWDDGGANRLWGEGGDDLLIFHLRSDAMSFLGDGGAGTDKIIIDLSSMAGAVSFSVLDALDAGSTATGVESFLIDGAGGDDILTGSSLNDEILGRAGDDQLFGGAGNDNIDGGGGSDRLFGGEGDDILSVTLDDASMGFGLEGGAGRDRAAIYIGAAWRVMPGPDARPLHFSIPDSLAAGSTATGIEAFELYGNDGDNEITGSAISDAIAGYNGDDRLFGADGDDQLAGGSGDDILVGGDGNDLLRGGYGDDILVGGVGSDQIDGSDGQDLLSYEDSAAGITASLDPYMAKTGIALGDEIWNVENLRGSAFDDILTGNDGANLIEGGAGNDILDGGAGADAMAGGTGDDIYKVDNIGDAVTEAAGAGIDTVQASIGYVLGANFERLVLTGAAALSGTGNAADNVITGNGGGNRLDGGAGADMMAGGLGDDVYVVDDAGDVVVEAPDGGEDTVYAGLSYILGANVERLVLTGTGALWGIGNASANVITGNAGANRLIGYDGNDQLYGGAGDDVLDGGTGSDVLDGGTGADSMWGGTGDDFYVVDDAGDAVVEAAGEGIDTVYASISYQLGANAERLALTGNAALWGIGNAADNIVSGNDGANRLIGNDGNDTLNGGAGQDVLDGGAGRDLLDGGTGADSLWGGAGDDAYVIDDAGDAVVEAVGEGFDTVYAGVSYMLAANVEQLALTGSAALWGLGNGGDNVISGNDGANRLIGYDGNDQLFGGAGQDVLDGGAGADRLDGGSGADSLWGGTGDDVYVVDDAGDAVVEAAGEGDDTVYASITHALAANVERLVLGGAADIWGIGNAGDNVIIGNDGANRLVGNDGNDQLFGGAGQDVLDGGAGNDRLDGGGGADTMSGGAGDDIYIVDRFGEAVAEAAGEGFDTVYSSATYMLSANVERLILLGTEALVGLGNAGDNILVGNEGANTLQGLGGNDVFFGNGGDDIIFGTAGNNVIDGGSGNDRLILYGELDYYTSSAAVGGQWMIRGIGTTNLVSNVETIELHSPTAPFVYSLADFVAATGGNSAPMASFAAFAPDDHLFAADQVDYGAGLI
jgi:Ca2+-binding RTX toxin-like protein